jgi:hypothetical protein
MRYFNASSQPYVSDFVPQDMNLIYKMQQDLVKEDEAALGAIEKASNAFNLKGGYRTGDAARLANQQYNTEVANISNNLNTGKLKPRDAVRQISTLLNHFNTNPEINLIKTDETLVPEVDKMIKENPGFTQSGLAPGWDPVNKTWKTLSNKDNLNTLKEGYLGLTPKVISDEEAVKSWYDKIKPDLDAIKGQGTWSTVTAPDGSTYQQQTINGKSIESIQKDKVRQLATNLYKSNPDALKNLQAFRYNKLNNDTFFPGSQYNDTDIIEGLVESFPSYYSRETETQKQGKSYSSPGNKENPEEIVPLYTTPGSEIGGIDYGNSFNLIKKGDSIPYTKEEIKNEYKKAGILNKDGSINKFGKAYELVASKIAAGKYSEEDTYLDIDKMPQKAQNLTLSTIKLIDKNLYDKVQNGYKLTKADKDKIYPILNATKKIAEQTILQSSTSRGLTPEEAKRTNLDLFGDKAEGSYTVENLGTGQSGNTKFFDVESKELITLEELKQKHDGKATASVRNELTPDNPFSFLTNDDSFVSPKQLFIEGKQYLISGPKEYVNKNTGNKKVTKNYQLMRNKVINKIYNSKFSLTPIVDNIYNKDVRITFKPDNINDRSKGKFIVGMDNKIEIFDTPYEADNYILTGKK